ncbi:hypothetical protein RvY_02297 [Ramazzottius varieornatus]|uniref:Uncharacterized protein n=1 Tax=Ramazzottius varieornatus TaxID=947166 RepID=A0A1D1UJA4_RAMVA|nr:hypothetical protein RvY_02297 [Ramazzottius varieornatus]
MAKSPVTPLNNKTTTKKRKTPPQTSLPTPKRLNFTPTSPEPAVRPGPSETPTTVGRRRSSKPATYNSSLSVQDVLNTSRRRYVSKIPPPKDWKTPLPKYAEGDDDPPDRDYDGEEYEHLEIIYYDQVRARLAEEENRELNSGTQDRTRSKMLSQIKWLRGTWNLYNVAPLFRFVYAPEERGPDGKEHDMAWCLRRQVTALVETLRTNTVFKQYRRTRVQVKPFLGFAAVKSYFDEPAYSFQVYGKKSEEDGWRELCVIIFGSLGTHQLEALWDIKGEQFAYYPFVLARGDDPVLQEVFQYLSERHGYKIGNKHGFRKPQFSSADMWRILTCGVFFIQRLRKSQVIRLTVTHQKNSPEVDWDFDLVEIVQQIRKRRSELSDKADFKHYMTARQVGLVREAVKRAYKEQFNREWDKKKTFLRKVQLDCLFVTSDGLLKTNEHKEAIAFLYYISRFQTRTYIHPIHGIRFDAINPEIEDYLDDEPDVENVGASASRLNSLFEQDTTYVADV